MIHHEFGSKALINKLHMMGHCVSYDEVRQFLTSVAADQLQRSKGVYIPNGLTRTTEHGIIDAAIDNFDQDEETLDGKNTTHSMAIVVYRRGDVATAHNPIPRIPERSLHALDSCDLENEEVQRYIKPGGIIGFTLRKGALKRWLIIRHVTSSEYCDAMTELCDSAVHAPKSHKEHGAARMDRDEREIKKIMEFVQDRQNPFDFEKVPDELINITSGQVASQNVAKDLSSFLEDGEKRNANVN
ncbi:hypothetical protein JOQ06_004518 [Pogonophryne albipinna]|uniref:Uncharacterized protein n=1 Tax=Pogonophryne albipinna TaxID=1090488 RepID=A0AAD6AQ82_9TELE|nr:hypothetical protein JOQ06_004518 [Pogonophryne albipinna]